MSKLKHPLLIARLNVPMSIDDIEKLQSYLNKQVEHLGIKAIVTDSSVETQLHQPISELVGAIKAQTEAINQLVASNIEILDQLIPENENEQERPESFDDLDSSEEIL
ncbi:hypothetical protein VCSRO160_2074 [Vibrio cholerae]|nr:hypothetical protein VCSRO160_2074 [Vibrio cholerae]